jgi:hypothetical protein
MVLQCLLAQHSSRCCCYGDIIGVLQQPTWGALQLAEVGRCPACRGCGTLLQLSPAAQAGKLVEAPAAGRECHRLRACRYV